MISEEEPPVFSAVLCSSLRPLWNDWMLVTALSRLMGSLSRGRLPALAFPQRLDLGTLCGLLFGGFDFPKDDVGIDDTLGGSITASQAGIGFQGVLLE